MSSAEFQGKLRGIWAVDNLLKLRLHPLDSKIGEIQNPNKIIAGEILNWWWFKEALINFILRYSLQAMCASNVSWEFDNQMK